MCSFFKFWFNTVAWFSIVRKFFLLGHIFLFLAFYGISWKTIYIFFSFNSIIPLLDSLLFSSLIKLFFLTAYPIPPFHPVPSVSLILIAVCVSPSNLVLSLSSSFFLSPPNSQDSLFGPWITPLMFSLSGFCYVQNLFTTSMGDQRNFSCTTTTKLPTQLSSSATASKNRFGYWCPRGERNCRDLQSK